MDYLSLIKQPIESELADFVDLFNKSLMHGDVFSRRRSIIFGSVRASECDLCSSC